MRNVQSVMEFPTISHRLPPFLLNAGKRLREILAIKMVVTPLEKVWIIRPAAATSALAPEDLSGPSPRTSPKPNLNPIHCCLNQAQLNLMRANQKQVGIRIRLAAARRRNVFNLPS